MVHARFDRFVVVDYVLLLPSSWASAESVDRTEFITIPAMRVGIANYFGTYPYATSADCWY
jgi:hypothetical protein